MTAAVNLQSTRFGRPAAWYMSAGVLLLLCFTQGWLFTNRVDSQVASSAENLASLQLEILDNRAANAALVALQSWWRSLPEGDTKRAALSLRDRTHDGFTKARADTIREFVSRIDEFALNPGPDAESFTTLQRETTELMKLYADAPLAALQYFEQPPWYLQPTAGLLNNNTESYSALSFNAGLYELYIGEFADALARFEALRRISETDAGLARVLFAIARLQYAIYESEPDPATLAAALDSIRQSLLRDPGVPAARQFLDYLLSTSRAALQIETDSEDGEGAGHGEGERGAISTSREKF